MAVNFSPIGNGFQFLTTTGLPLNGGLLYAYQAGSTTPLTTYTDPSGLIANTNPIVLGTDGRPPQEIWFADGYNYKFVLADSNNIVIAIYDNLYGIPTANAVANPTVIPSGLISLWSGSIGSIPSGWVLCDGNNSTPNLTDRFIVGAGGSYAVAGQGGAADATLVSHSHTYTPSGSISTASITGSFPTATTNTTYSGVFSQGTTYSGNGSDPQPNALVNMDASHSHSFTGNSDSVSTVGTSATNANLPPYYALAYIMKS